MKRYTQTSGALVETHDTLDGKPTGQWVEWKDVEVLLAELNLLRSERARTEALPLEQQWREWVNEGDVTEDAVRAGAKVIAASPLIDAPKLSHNEWMGLSRAILEAAFAVSPQQEKSNGR